MYTPKSYRQLKQFIGELTATNAGIHAVLLDFENSCGENGQDELSNVAAKHYIVLKGVSPRDIVNSQSRLSLVSVLSGFDRYFKEVESECKELEIPWGKPDKTSPIIVLQKNISEGQSLSSDTKAALKVIEYYRMVRNWVTHPSGKNRKNAEDAHKDAANEINHVRIKYGFQSAPNTIDEICFHDVKLLSKLLLDGLKEVSGKIRPTNLQLISSIPNNFLSRDGGRTKRIKRAAKYLECEFGIDYAQALAMVETNYDALA